MQTQVEVVLLSSLEFGDRVVRPCCHLPKLESKIMTQSLDVQELAIVLVAPNHRPTMLNLEFLRCGNIIPDDWNVIRPPVQTQQAAQLVFQNGVSFSAQSDQISLVEPIGAKNSDEIWIPHLARRYVELLPHAGYQAIGINVRGFVNFSVQEQDAARQFLTQTLLAPGTWQEYGQQGVRAGLNLAYRLSGRQLLLSIHEVKLQKGEAEAVPGIMFSGNFEYRLAQAKENERAENLPEQVLSVLDQWQTDLKVYTDLINTHFLPHLEVQQPFGTLPLEPEIVEPELVPMG
jgi:hypothetical protein